jgi:hypothetical protein
MLMGTELKRITFKASGAVTAAATVTTDWVDVGSFNEGYFWLNVTAFASRVDETLDVTIERKADGLATGYVTIATFTQVATAAATAEEETVTAATGLLGGKIRARYITGGTWSSKSMTFSIIGEVKKV